MSEEKKSRKIVGVAARCVYEITSAGENETVAAGGTGWFWWCRCR